MNEDFLDCTNHPGVEATLTCTNCWRHFCGECMGPPSGKKDLFGREIIICPDCRIPRVHSANRGYVNLGSPGDLARDSEGVSSQSWTPGTCRSCGTPVLQGKTFCHRCSGLAPEAGKAGKGAFWAMGLALAIPFTCGLSGIAAIAVGLREIKRIGRGEAPVEGKVIAWASVIGPAFLIAGAIILLAIASVVSRIG